MFSPSSEPSDSFTNSNANDEGYEYHDEQQKQHESDSELPSNPSNLRRSTRLKRVDNTTASTPTAAQDVRKIPIKELLNNKRRRRSMKMMPSTLKKLQQRKRRRLSNATEEQGQEKDQSDQEQEKGGNEPEPDPEEPIPEPHDPEPRPEPQPQANNDEQQQNNKEDEDEDEDGVVAPQVKIDENGNIIIDQQSLFVSANNNDGQDNFNITNTTIENNNPFGNHVSSASFKKRESSLKWSADETNQFYDALRTFGTDFSLMTHLFPKRSRRQLKLKFKREERESSKRIDQTLNGPRVPIPNNISTQIQKNDNNTNNNDNDNEGKNSNENTNPSQDENQNNNSNNNSKQIESQPNQNEVVGRVSDDEDDMLNNYEAAPDDFDDDDDFDSDDD